MGEIYLLLEGDDDERLFRQVIIPLMKNKGFVPIIWKYSNETSKEISKRLDILSKMKEDYILFADLDKAQCVTERKSELRNIYRSLDEMRIIVIVKAIEGWYAAGITENGCEKLGLHEPCKTEDFDHSKFKKWTYKKFRKESFGKMAILQHFSPRIARERNESFGYFFKRFCC
ncbi:MAG: hypothetical protein KAU48_11060 [Candidatus Thorarchaeota archaeon]|nr:hypothetical protein [Candidatus Thorarchaeota archaeon]